MASGSSKMEMEVDGQDERQFTAITSKAAISTFDGKQILDKLTKLHREFLDKIEENKCAPSEVKRSAESTIETGKMVFIANKMVNALPTYYLHELISLRNRHVLAQMVSSAVIVCVVLCGKKSPPKKQECFST
ncbi:hypothetical protein V3C99_001099 [Haemonchus contortus]